MYFCAKQKCVYCFVYVHFFLSFIPFWYHIVLSSSVFQHVQLSQCFYRLLVHSQKDTAADRNPHYTRANSSQQHPRSLFCNDASECWYDTSAVICHLVLIRRRYSLSLLLPQSDNSFVFLHTFCNNMMRVLHTSRGVVMAAANPPAMEPHTAAS